MIDKNLRLAVDAAIIEIRGEHRPEWSSDEMQAKGKEPIGCVMCFPQDGSWPCLTSTVADDLERALAAGTRKVDIL